MDLNKLKSKNYKLSPTIQNNILVTGSAGCGKTTYTIKNILPFFLKKHKLGFIISSHFDYLLDIIDCSFWFDEDTITIHNNFLPHSIDYEGGRKHIVIINQPQNISRFGIDISIINNLDFIIDNNPFLFIDEPGLIQTDLESVIKLFNSKVITIDMFSNSFISGRKEPDRMLPMGLAKLIDNFKLILCGRLPGDLDPNLRKLDIGEFLKLAQ